jgi:hypothetical protein
MPRGKKRVSPCNPGSAAIFSYVQGLVPLTVGNHKVTIKNVIQVFLFFIGRVV